MDARIDVTDEYGRRRLDLVVRSVGASIPAPAREDLRSWIGATGLSLQDMQRRARIFHGDVQVHAAGDETGDAAMNITIRPFDAR